MKFSKKIMLWGVISIAFCLTGCHTVGVKEDSFPPPITAQCHKARADAVVHYRKVWKEEPYVGRPVKVLITQEPPQGYGAITRGSGRGYIIEIWKSQNPFFGSLVHEFGHTLKLQNGKGGGEEGL